MLIALVAIALLIASVAAIYFILRSMGEDGVEIAAPGSCKSGSCGVRKVADADAGCHQAEALPGESHEVVALEQEDAVMEQPGKRPG
ncbi:MAG: hypothetical protein NDI67_13150 [Sulfuritalea sp.]|nr:hypothetical protein [Sulfuritalea sp.]